MADVSIKYKGVEKATLNASGSKTIKTSGKYCEADIVVDYTDPEKPTQTKSMSLGASAPSTVTPDSGKVLSSVSPSIDTSVINAENIKQGVQVLGITGTHQGGITPSGTKSITENGTYDVTEYASANVNLPIYEANVTFASTVYNATIITLPDDVYTHINEPTFTVRMEHIPYSYVQYCAGLVYCSNIYYCKTNTIGVYGAILRPSASEASFQCTQFYYPCNETNNNIGNGGAGKIWVSEKNLKWNTNSHPLGGTYKVTISWQ